MRPREGCEGSRCSEQGAPGPPVPPGAEGTHREAPNGCGKNSSACLEVGHSDGKALTHPRKQVPLCPRWLVQLVPFRPECRAFGEQADVKCDLLLTAGVFQSSPELNALPRDCPARAASLLCLWESGERLFGTGPGGCGFESQLFCLQGEAALWPLVVHPHSGRAPRVLQRSCGEPQA